MAQGTAKKLTFIVILMTVISILEYVGPLSFLRQNFITEPRALGGAFSREFNSLVLELVALTI